MTNKGFDLNSMRQTINRVIGDTFGGGTFSVPVDVVETEDSIIVLTVPLLGIIPETIDVSISGNQLTLSGETAPQDTYPAEAYVKRERRYGQLSRKVTLSADIDADRAKAELKDGVLKVTLPKIPEAEPKIIKVVSQED